MRVGTAFKLIVGILVIALGLSWYEGWNPQKIVGTTDYRSAGNRKRLADAKDEPNTAALELTYNPTVTNPHFEPDFVITWIINGNSHHDRAAKQGIWFRVFSVKPGDVILAQVAQNNGTYPHNWDVTIWHVRATGGVGDSCQGSIPFRRCTVRYVVK